MWVAKLEDAQQFLSEMSAHKVAINARISSYSVRPVMEYGK